MESFRFSYYPMSTHRAGKRPLPPPAPHERDNDNEMEPHHAHKRLKQGGSPEWMGNHATAGSVSSTNPPTLAAPPQTPRRSGKRDLDATGFLATTAETINAPLTRRRLMDEKSQSAGQVTTESPMLPSKRHEKPHDTTSTAAAAVDNNSLLGQLHAERRQRQAHNPPQCPLTQGMHAMSIQSATPGSAKKKHCVQLKTDSKLG